MECGTLLKMAGVYNFAAACVCGVVAQRTVSENVIIEQKDIAVTQAIEVAIRAAENIE
jgi:uridine phosphorylase